MDPTAILTNSTTNLMVCMKLATCAACSWCLILSFLTLGHINISHLFSIISGLHHWAESFLANDDRRDEAIVLIDPDFLFLNTFEFPENTPPVLPKKPAAAKYGLGGQVRTFSSLHHLRT